MQVLLGAAGGEKASPENQWLAEGGLEPRLGLIGVWSNSYEGGSSFSRNRTPKDFGVPLGFPLTPTNKGSIKTHPYEPVSHLPKADLFTF